MLSMKTFFYSALLVAPLTLGMVSPAVAEDAPAEAAPAAETAKPVVAVSMEIAVGASAKAVLGGNPTTGFTWNVASQEGDSVEVSVELMPAEVDENEPPVCGAPSPTAVTFKGVKPGKSVIVLEYKRAWETDTPADKTETFVVTVK